MYGKAGSGKTYLLRHWADALADDGHQSLAFAACTATRDLSLGVFASALDIGQSFDKAHAIQVATQQLLDHGRGRRVALIIDDAHLLDESSVAVVHQLVTAAPDQSAKCSVWLSVRTGEPLNPALIDLWKSDHLHRIDLDPLTGSESHDVAAALLGSPPEPSLAHALHERSQGCLLYTSPSPRD